MNISAWRSLFPPSAASGNAKSDAETFLIFISNSAIWLATVFMGVLRRPSQLKTKLRGSIQL